MIDRGEQNTRADDVEAAWMRRLADAPVEGPPLPDPQVLWWKASALRRQQASRRSEEVADYIQVGAAVAAAVALLTYLLAITRLSLLTVAIVLPVAFGVALLLTGIAIASVALRARLP
jgi:cobalamin biosynthesis protein CobD/CbiB